MPSKLLKVEKMEVNDTTIEIFRSCRWSGVAPYNIVRNGFNQIVDITINRRLCIYSLILLVVLMLLSNMTVIIGYLKDESMRLTIFYGFFTIFSEFLAVFLDDFRLFL